MTAGERRLVWTLRLLAVVFGTGALVLLARPEESVQALSDPGLLLGLRGLPESPTPVSSDFWFPHAVAHLATLAVLAWMASEDAPRRRGLVGAVVVSLLVCSGTAWLLFVQWARALPFLATGVVDLATAVLLLVLLRRS
ncbi:MAG: hypothetical protein KIT14_02505 [bacterium]|nr:hypothetical protein [bacterium]